jgi:hypothetical protein
MNKAAKIGVNGAAALKSLQNNLKLAQRFNFKGGIAGLAKLSAEATKLKLDMEGIAGMAEKVFRPEGAIEMAAQLTTMGGKFASLGDPMQLMFKARNDFEGFAKDIGKASAEFVQFNKETGEFNIKNGLSDTSPYIKDKLKNYLISSGNFLQLLRQFSNNGRGESWQNYIRGIFNTKYIKNTINNASFEFLDSGVLNEKFTPHKRSKVMRRKTKKARRRAHKGTNWKLTKPRKGCQIATTVVAFRDDLTRNDKNKKFEDVGIFDFSFNSETEQECDVCRHTIYVADLVIFVDTDGRTKILKNRFGNRGK